MRERPSAKNTMTNTCTAGSYVIALPVMAVGGTITTVALNVVVVVVLALKDISQPLTLIKK